MGATTFGGLTGGNVANGAGGAGLATVVGSAKLGESTLGGEGGAKGKNGFCAGTAETAAGNGGGPFGATAAAGTAVIGNGGGPLRTGAAAGTATNGAGTVTAAAAGRTGEGCKAGLVRLGRGGGAAGFTSPGLAGRDCTGSDERTRTDDWESNGGRGDAGRGAIAGRGGGLIGNVK